MKNRIMRIWLLLASIVFFVMLANAADACVMIFFAVGVITGILILKYGKERPVSGSKGRLAINILLDLCIMFFTSAYFYFIWGKSPEVNSALRLFSEKPALLLRILSLLLGLFTFPFVHFYVSKLFILAVRALKTVGWKKIWTVRTPNGKLFLRSLGIGFANVTAAALVGLLLLTAAYKLPLDNIIENVHSSAYIMEKEGTFPYLTPLFLSRLDNYTDAYMLLEASDETEGSDVERALMAYSGRIEGKVPDEVLVEHFLHGKEFTSVENYARYWHGYHLFLKPLLEIADYGAVRMINGIVQAALAALICLLLKKRGLGSFIVPFILSYLMLMPVALAMSMQYSSCYYALSLGMIALLLLPEEKRRRYAWLIFLNIGIFVAYYDFLTYPMAAFGIPAVLLLALSREDEAELKLRSMVENGMAWCAGYGGMWLSKWVLTALLTDFNIFDDAVRSFLFRTSTVDSEGKGYTTWKCIVQNYVDFANTCVTIVVLLFMAALFISLLKNEHRWEAFGIMAPYIVIALSPVVWFVFASNHSMVHHMFTNKSCVVSLMAILFGLTEASLRIKNRNSVQ